MFVSLTAESINGARDLLGSARGIIVSDGNRVQPLIRTEITWYVCHLRKLTHWISADGSAGSIVKRCQNEAWASSR